MNSNVEIADFVSEILKKIPPSTLSVFPNKIFAKIFNLSPLEFIILCTNGSYNYLVINCQKLGLLVVY